MSIDLSGVQVKTDYIEFKGGFDQINTLINSPPGRIVDGANFECDSNGGYARIAGYERFDGHASPSDALYYSASFGTPTSSFVAGSTLTGNTSGATGVIAAYDTTYVYLTQIVGTFQSGEVVNISATDIATLTSTFGLGGATGLLHAQYTVAAADVYRALISAVPGSGSILGVNILSDVVYAFRANAGATAVDMYASSASGWTQVVFDKEISFSNANTSVGDGDTLTQGAVTSTIKRVVLQTGTLASGTNTGRLIISTPSGGTGSYIAGAATSTGAGTLTLGGAQTSITLALSATSKFEFSNYAFSTNVKMYGCDGVNRGFEYGLNDAGVMVFVPITTGMTTDVPSHLACHRNYLFFSFASSAQFSGLVSPYQWTIVSGGGELNVGDTITALLPQIGSDSSASMMIFCRNLISVLYGTSSSNFTRQVLRDGIGCMPRSAQNIGVALALDDRGIIMMGPTLNWGNFDQGTISRAYNEFLNDKKSRTSASSVHRGKNQFRLFFSDGSGIYVTVFQGQPIGAIPVSFDNAVTCIVNNEFSTGDERTFFGSTNGMVYELDKGPNFDGSSLNAYITMPYNSRDTPRFKKRYRKIVLDGRFTNFTELLFGYQIGYGTSAIMQPVDESITMADGSSTWDSSFWDTMIWDGGFIPLEINLDGSGENIQFIFQNNTNYVEPFTLSGVILHHNLRRLLR